MFLIFKYVCLGENWETPINFPYIDPRESPATFSLFKENAVDDLSTRQYPNKQRDQIAQITVENWVTLRLSFIRPTDYVVNFSGVKIGTVDNFNSAQFPL